MEMQLRYTAKFNVNAFVNAMRGAITCVGWQVTL